MFAKQQSVIDVILRLLYGREEELVGKVSETLLVVFVNFMSGLSLSVFIFLFRLPWMIATFQPNLVSEREKVRRCLLSVMLVTTGIFLISGGTTVLSLMLLMYDLTELQLDDMGLHGCTYCYTCSNILTTGWHACVCCRQAALPSGCCQP